MGSFPQDHFIILMNVHDSDNRAPDIFELLKMIPLSTQQHHLLFIK